MHSRTRTRTRTYARAHTHTHTHAHNGSHRQSAHMKEACPQNRYTDTLRSMESSRTAAGVIHINANHFSAPRLTSITAARVAWACA